MFQQTCECEVSSDFVVHVLGCLSRLSKTQSLFMNLKYSPELIFVGLCIYTEDKF
jgi:hypothetical protein